MENSTAVARRPHAEAQNVHEAKGEITYTPFASADAIKLTVAIVQKWLCKPTRSGQICTESDAMRFMMLCRARRLNPWEGDAYLVGYDGKNGAEFSLITAHQALLKRCEPQPTFQGIDSGVIVSPGWPCKACDEGFRATEKGVDRCPMCHGSGTIDEVQGDLVPPNQTLIGGWAHIERSDRKIPIHRRLSLKAYKPGYQNKFWDDNPAGQIVKCAEADVQRSAYPTLVGGMITEGETGFSMVVKESNGSSYIASPPPVKQVSAPPSRTPSAPPAAAATGPTTPTATAPRRGTTLVEAPVSEDERLEALAGLAPSQAPPGEPHDDGGPKMSLPQIQLQEIITEAGHNFDAFRVWGAAELKNGDSTTGILAWEAMGGFGDVPDRACKFLIRAKAGMLAALQAAKEGVGA